MKKQFWFIVLFGVWCLLSALWYFFNVRGVSTQPESFQPELALTAILEILLMILVACLLGYAIAWWMRAETIAIQNEKLEHIHRENHVVTESEKDLRKQVELWREKHQAAAHVLEQKSLDVAAENEKLQRAKQDLELTVAELKQERSEGRTNLKETENELENLKNRIRQLEFQVKASEDAQGRLKSEIQELLLSREKAVVSDHPFVRSVEPDEKDDLTKIKGIGPFIEKRLNMIGIYTFQHLSELSPEMIDRVGAAIEFFPHRIIKDNWVGQAQVFSYRRI